MSLLCPTRPLATSVIRVVMIEDHHMVADALGALLGAEPDVEVVGIATSIGEGMTAVAQHQPDVVLTDLCLTDGEITDHLGDLRRSSPASHILLMTGSPSQRALLDAVEGGVLGFVDKAGPVTELVDAVRRVASGELVASTNLAPVLLARLGSDGRPKRHDLTRRELEVLQRLARGASTAAVASELALSANTVRNHIARAMLKLGTHSRLAAVSEASRLGLISAY